jgi:hypothetical protein
VTYLNPFVQRVSFESNADAERLLARLEERLSSVQDTGKFETSLAARGAVKGRFADNAFVIDEAMFGFGGAKAKGAIQPRGRGSVLTATLRPGPVMRYAAPFMATVYALGAWIVIKAAVAGETPSKLLIAFAMETCLFGCVWAMALHEMRPLRRMLADVAAEAAAPL